MRDFSSRKCTLNGGVLELFESKPAPSISSLVGDSLRGTLYPVGKPRRVPYRNEPDDADFI